MKKRVNPFEKPDSAGTEIAVRAGIEEAGISLQAKSRALAAFDRMIGSAFDIPGAWFERRAERARIMAATEQEAMKIDAKNFLKTRRTNPGSQSAWLNNIRHQIENKTEVASYAIEELKIIDSDKGTNDTEKTSCKYSFEDWLNAFVHRAEMASSNEMRSILGRILAGEIVRPLSFSVATLRIVSELDQHAASLFQDLCLIRLNDRALVRNEKEIDSQRRFDLFNLEERGLLKEVGGNFESQLGLVEGFYYLRQGDKILKMVIEPKNEVITVSTVIPVMFVTTAGLQLASLLPHDDEKCLISVSDALQHHEAVKMIELCDVKGDHLVAIRKLIDRQEKCE